MALADAYQAITTGRPYRPARDHAAALAELRREAGRQFDPALVEHFCAAFADAAPADGLDAVYALGEAARGEVARLLTVPARRARRPRTTRRSPDTRRALA